ncbi:MAG: cell division protein FtsZ [Candidatus Puniceispirillum sp.]|nr:cell division protein FtsZ [Candidatus Puniceispirillum sp.]
MAQKGDTDAPQGPKLPPQPTSLYGHPTISPAGPAPQAPAPVAQVPPAPTVAPAPTPLPPLDLELKPRITVVGVGGAGNNAVNNMIRSKLQGVQFISCNTDAQALAHSLSEKRIQLGTLVTQGLGAGSRPEVGRAAAEESLETLMDAISGSNMVFITAGMGGGTGTGAAPVVAQAARSLGILTVAVATKPFHFEGNHRMRTAERGIEELAQHVDTLIIIPNQNLFRVANEKTTFADAFKMADDVLHSGVRGVTDLMMMPGLINLDFADIRSVMSEMGKAMMGTGEANGDGRAIAAAEAAISNPLLDDVSMRGAQGVLINITGGMDMTLFEVDEAANRIRDEVDPDANIIFGSTFDEKLNGIMRVSVVATGIEADEARKRCVFTAKQAEAEVAAPVQEESAPMEEEELAREVVEETYGESDENLTEDAFERARQEFAHYFQENAHMGQAPAPVPEKKQGFFSRLAASMKGDTSSRDTRAPARFQEMEPPQRPTSAKKEAHIQESAPDAADIPSFMRRKPRN